MGTLMKERIFDPLQMTSAGFGPTGNKEKEDQPWGHTKPLGVGDWNPQQSDNSELFGPAGTVHCTMEDWGKFISFQLLNQDTSLLSQEQRNKLLVPVKDAYACGWLVLDRSWANGNAIHHAGSNTMNYAVAWVAPNIDKAYLVCTNSYSLNTGQLCDKIIGALMKLED